LVSSRPDVGQASVSLGRTALIHLFSAALTIPEHNITPVGFITASLRLHTFASTKSKHRTVKFTQLIAIQQVN